MTKLSRLLLLTAALALPALPASAGNCRLLSSWDQSFAYNPYIVKPFLEGMKKATAGRLDCDMFGVETVPQAEQLEPVASGVFQFLWTHGAYHAGTTPIMLLADALQGDLAKVRASGVLDYIDKEYQKLGLKLISAPLTPPGAYQLILRDPVGANGALTGKIIRGSVSFKGVIEALGAVLTVLPVSETHTGMEKRVFDGSGVTAISTLDYKWYEVARHLLRPSFGQNYEPIFMNLRAWNALSPEDQKAVLQVAREMEDAWYKQAPVLWKAEEDALIKLGMKVTKMGDGYEAKLEDVWGAGLWAIGRQRNPDATEKFYQFAVKAGLAK